MVYSLTNASALGLDLVRVPGGVEVAGLLLRGLLAPPPGRRDPAPVQGPADLRAARSRAWGLVGRGGPTVVDLTDRTDGTDVTDGIDLAGGPAAVDPDAGGDELALTVRRLLRRLGAVSFGSVADLMTLAADLPAGGPTPARDRSGDAAPRVVDDERVRRGAVLADAVLAAVVLDCPDPAGPVLARALRHRLDPPAPSGPALPPVPGPGDAVRACGPTVLTSATADLLCALSAVEDPEDLLLGHGPAPHVWAEHMHEAAWAVETTGRTRVAAAAQLDLVRCLHAAGVTGALSLAGVWNTCSAAVQAHVVADVLGPDSWSVLAEDLLDAIARR